MTVEAFKPNETPLPSANVMADSRFEVVPAETRILLRVAAFDCMAVVNHVGCDSDTARPAVLCVIEPEMDAPPVNPDVVPAALPAFKLRPELLTVHAKGPAVSAVFSPIASLLAR